MKDKLPETSGSGGELTIFSGCSKLMSWPRTCCRRSPTWTSNRSTVARTPLYRREKNVVETATSRRAAAKIGEHAEST